MVMAMAAVMARAERVVMALMALMTINAGLVGGDASKWGDGPGFDASAIWREVSDHIAIRIGVATWETR